MYERWKEGEKEREDEIGCSIGDNIQYDSDSDNRSSDNDNDDFWCSDYISWRLTTYKV